MFIAFCLAVPVVAYALLRVEKNAGEGKKGPWRPPQHGREESRPPE